MRLKTSLTILIVSLLTSVIVMVNAYFIIRNRARIQDTMLEKSTFVTEAMVSKGRALARNVALSSQRAIVMSDFLFLREIIENTVQNDPDLIYGIIMNEEQRALVHSNPTKSLTILTDSSAQFANNQSKSAQYKTQTAEGVPVLEIIEPIALDEEERVTIRFGFSLTKLNREIADLKQTSSSEIMNDAMIAGLGAFIIMSLAIVGGLSAARQLVNPLQRLVVAVKSVTAGNLETLVEIRKGPAEFVELEKAFNQMTSAVKDRENALNQLQSYLQNIINSMPSALLSVNTEGNVVQWNTEAESQTGVSAKDAQGKNVADIYPMLADEMHKVQTVINSRIPLRQSRITTNAPAGNCYSEVTVYPLISDGIEGAVIRVDDITEKVRLQELMVQSEKMLSVGGLAAGMAHEINNPLAGIIQNMQVIQTRVSSDRPANQKVANQCGLDLQKMNDYLQQRKILGMFETVIDSGQRASTIIRNMLNFSRQSTSKHAEQNLAQLIDQTIELAYNDYDIKKETDFRKIKITREYESEKILVICESGEIQQVILNIITNGTHAMSEWNNENGRPAPELIIRLKRDHEVALIELEDNGPGMEETVRRRVFEPFYTTKRVGVGTGLGLSVSYFIITEKHDGTMSVVSSPGHGTKFIITLPLCTTKESQ